jgi:hypothetical protein
MAGHVALKKTFGNSDRRWSEKTAIGAAWFIGCLGIAASKGLPIFV